MGSVNRLHIATDNEATMLHPNGATVTGFGSNSVFSEELTSTCVIAIQAENNDFQIGIIASTDDHVVTNATWRCTN